MNKLPSGYQQVEYIQSSGTQYIDTNYTVNNNNTIETKIELLEKNSDNKMIFGTRSGASSNNISINATNDIVLDFNNSSYANYRATYNYQVNTPYILYSSKNRRVIYSNNKEQILAENSTVCSDTITTSVNSYIFYINPKPADTWYLAKMKLYYLKIYENDNLVRNFIPCYRKSDNEIGLYDIVNDVFYTNQGTGTFLRGDNITVADKLSYLRETKEQIKNKINFLTGELTDETPFREYTNALDNLYSELPKTSQDGTSITLANTRRGKITITPKGNTVQAILPSEYQQVEYIESSGTQYIDTGYKPNQGDEFTFKNVSYNISSNSQTLFSAGTGTYQFILILSNTTYYKYFSSGTASSMLTQQNSNLEIQATGDGKIFYNDVFQMDNGNAPKGEVDSNLFLFKRANDTSYASAKMGEIIIKNNDNLVRDLIPCYRKADNEIGLYDLVTNVFLINQGTGTFKKGNDIPNPDYPQDIKVVTGENNITVGGKNLSEIDRSDSENNPTTRSGLTYYYNKNTITVTGKNTATATGQSFIFKKKFPAGTYTISGLPNKEVGNNDRGTIYIWTTTTPNAGLSNADDTQTSVYYKKTITISQEAYIGFRIISNNSATGIQYNQTYNIQIEEGNTATEYEPYIEPIEKELNLGNLELCKIGDYSDLIFKNEKTNPYYDNTLVENGWYKKEIINKIIFNGTEGWRDTYAAFSLASLDRSIIASGGICNYYLYDSRNYGMANLPNNYFAVQSLSGNTASVIYIQNRSFSTAEAFKSDLAQKYTNGNPVCIYYPLQTSTNIQITETTLINQLEELNKVIGTGGTVVIETESEEENAQLIVNASALASFENS